MSGEAEFERLLEELGAGSESAGEELYRLVHEELRALAGSVFARRGSGPTLQPTVLVNEAWLRLSRGKPERFSGREHFLAVAARAMRQVLANHARERRAEKRGGGARRVTLAEPLAEATGRALDVVALDDALQELARRSPRQARVVDLRYFGGLTIAETARVLGVGTTTVEDDWQLARAWLARALSSG